MANQNGSILIKVTQEDIDKGSRGSPSRCPIARAVRRATGNPTVRVYSTKAAFGPFIFSPNADLPARAQKFVSQFDRTSFGESAIEPFSFRLKLPEAVQRG